MTNKTAEEWANLLSILDSYFKERPKELREVIDYLDALDPNWPFNAPPLFEALNTLKKEYSIK